MKRKTINWRVFTLTPCLMFFICSFINAQEPILFTDANGKHGFKNKSGQIIIPSKYDEAYDFDQGIAPVKFGKKWGYIDQKGNEVISLKYDSIQKADKSKLFIIKLNEKWGYLDASGKELTPVKYTVARGFAEGRARVNLNGKWGFIDTLGKEIVIPKYDSVRIFTNGHAIVFLNRKQGVVDLKGKELIQPAYDAISEIFQSKIYKIRIREKWGFADSTGKQIVVPKYDSIGLFRNGRAIVFLNRKAGVVDLKGKEIAPLKYDMVQDFYEKFMLVRLDGKWGALDNTGKEITPIKYNAIEIAYFDHYQAEGWDETGWLNVKLNPGDSWKLMDQAGRELKFDEYSPFGFSEGLLAVASQKKWGYINEKGNEAISMKYNEANDFEHGEGRVSLNGQWGYIDKTGAEVVPMKYEDTYRLINYDQTKGNLHKIRSNGKWGVLDSSGKEIIAPKFDDIGFIGDGLLPVKLDGMWGYANLKGQLIIQPQYEDAHQFAKGKAWVKKDGKTFTIIHPLINSTNNQTTEAASNTQRPSIPPAVITPTTNSPRPPTFMNGGVDLSLVGLWTATYPSGINVYFDFKPNGMYVYYTGDYSPSSAYNHKCYWRIDGTFMKTFCDGATQVDRSSFNKGYDAANKPTLKIGEIIFFPADKKTSW